MVLHMDISSVLTKESKKSQEPENMNRYTGNVTEITDGARGRGYLNIRRNPRRTGKEKLCVRIYRLFRYCREMKQPGTAPAR